MQIELRDVCCSYSDSNTILDQIDLSIDHGDFLGIIGRSGSGKTTLLETIGGFHTPKSGTVVIEDKNIYSKGMDSVTFRRMLQIVFQFPENQFFETNVRKELEFGLLQLQISAEERGKRIQEIIEKIFSGNEKILDESPFTLSGGQKRKLALACSLVLKPKILLLDEPFSGLDADGISAMVRLLKDENKKGMTILLVSHDPDIVCSLANKIIVLSHGKIADKGTPYEVYQPDKLQYDSGIGLPNTVKITRKIGLPLSQDISYDSFLNKAMERYSGKSL